MVYGISFTHITNHLKSAGRGSPWDQSLQPSFHALVFCRASVLYQAFLAQGTSAAKFAMPTMSMFSKTNTRQICRCKNANTTNPRNPGCQPCLGQRCKRILCRCRCSRRNQDCTPHIPAAFSSLSWTSAHFFVFCVLHFLMFFRFCHRILQHPTRQIKQDSSQRREDHEVNIINPLAVPPHLEFAMPAVCMSCTLHRHHYCTRMACTWNPSTHSRHCRRCTGCPCPGRSDPCTSCSWNSLLCCTGKVHK